jgi:hypothetical protein
MADYAISGVWKDSKGVITHCAVHEISIINSFPIYSFAEKYSKERVLTLFDNQQNTIRTIVWDYAYGTWKQGAFVRPYRNGTNIYFRTIQDGTVKDNLDNLINYGWITVDFQ